MLLSVADVMSDDVVSVAESTSLHSTLAVMRRRRVRRVPVLAADSVLVGVLAADDFVAMLTRELRALAELFLERRHAEGQARP
jgi:CBS-domain-containing membrane protein